MTWFINAPNLSPLEAVECNRQSRCAAAGIRSARILIAAAMSSYFFVNASAPAAAASELPPAPTEVLAITIKSERLMVESLIDRKSYSVASDAQSTFGSLSAILSNIPSIDVDATGIVSLRGDSKVLILIDGKPSSQFAGVRKRSPHRETHLWH